LGCQCGRADCPGRWQVRAGVAPGDHTACAFHPLGLDDRCSRRLVIKVTRAA
jgi:hypothetical protein